MIVGWIAPVSGDAYKVRCLYCHIIIRAHYRDLKAHARTAKHSHSVTLSRPGCVADLRKPAEKLLLNRKWSFGPRRTTRFGLYFYYLLSAHTQTDFGNRIQVNFI